jgi:hypothetical protein
MADSLIADDKNNAPNNQLASGSSINSPYTPLPTYNQATFGRPDPQRGCTMYPSPSPFPSPYVASPLQPASVRQNAGYSPAYPNTQHQYSHMDQPPYSNIQQAQYLQQPPQYGQMNYLTYGAPQQQQPAMYHSSYQPVFRGSDEKEIVSTQV